MRSTKYEVQKSCGGRNRTCVRAVNSRPPVPTQDTAIAKSGRWDLNPRSPVPATTAIRRGARRISRLSNALNHSSEQRPAGVEPALPPWHGSRLPLHHGRVESLIELSKNESTRPRLFAAVPGHEPTLPHYGCGILAAGRPVLIDCCLPKWDQRGSNPHRPATEHGCPKAAERRAVAASDTARHAASNTLIPITNVLSKCGKVGAEGVEPSTLSL